MSKLLTNRQHQVLEVLREYIDKNGYAPSIRELGQSLDISSLRGVTIHLDALEKKGWIHRESTSRSIKILIPLHSKSSTYCSAPLIGKIVNTDQILSKENIAKKISIPESFMMADNNLFAVKIEDESMEKQFIARGDIAIVHIQKIIEDKSIVAALIDNKIALGQIDSQTQPQKIFSTSQNYIDRNDFTILGKVIGLIRSYKFA